MRKWRRGTYYGNQTYTIFIHRIVGEQLTDASTTTTTTTTKTTTTTRTTITTTATTTTTTPTEIIKDFND